jgi:hypothetical protein
MPQAHRKGRAIAQVPRKDLLEMMNALITPRLFFWIGDKRACCTSASVLCPHLLRFCKIRPGVIPVKFAIKKKTFRLVHFEVGFEQISPSIALKSREIHALALILHLTGLFVLLWASVESVQHKFGRAHKSQQAWKET